MKVKAKELVYYNNKRYRPGQEFELIHRKGLDGKGKPIEITPEQQFSEKSMEKLEKADVAKAAPKPAPKPAPKAPEQGE